VERQPDLLEIVGALRLPGRLARRSDGRQDHRHEDPNHSRGDENLDEREAPRRTANSTWGNERK
jgi:hypothetical protein